MAKKKTPRKKQDLRGAKKKRNGSKSRSPRKPNASNASRNSGEQRLQRILANAGLGSRRECEKLIEEGRVEVDGKFVTKLGVKVDPAERKIRVDGVLVKIQRLQYFAVNKPPGVVSTSNDPSGRMRVIDLIKTSQRVYNVGRLDKSSEGLMLVTNDGDLANRLTHPRYGVQKTYLVQVVGQPASSDLKKLERGVYLAEGLAKVVGARIKSRTKDHTMLEIILEEGRNREIRRLLASIGHKVIRLRRVAIGTLRLGDMPLGAHRSLEKREIDALKRVANEPQAKKAGHVKRVGKRSKGGPEKFAKLTKGASKGKGKASKTAKGKSKAKSDAARDEARAVREAIDAPRRKRKPKVGEEGWTIKSGGKPRKKNYPKKVLAEIRAKRQERDARADNDDDSGKPRRKSKSGKKKGRSAKTKFSKGKSARGKSKGPSQGRGQARAAAKSAGRKSKKAGKKSVARGKRKRK